MLNEALLRRNEVKDPLLYNSNQIIAAIQAINCLGASKATVHLPLSTVVLSNGAACRIRTPGVAAIGKGHWISIDATCLDLQCPWELAGDAGSRAALCEAADAVLVCVVDVRDCEGVSVLGWVRLLVLGHVHATLSWSVSLVVCRYRVSACYLPGLCVENLLVGPLESRVPPPLPILGIPHSHFLVRES
jgi:hypothetical protein